MWVIIELECMSIFTIISILRKIGKNHDHIILSFDSSKNCDETNEIIKAIIQECESLGINVSIGPIFLEDEIIIDENPIIVEELFVASIVDKLKWCLENTDIVNSINTIGMVSTIIGIEPLAISQKIARENKNYNFEFYYADLLISDIASLVDKDQFRFTRIKRRKK